MHAQFLRRFHATNISNGSKYTMFASHGTLLSHHCRSSDDQRMVKKWLQARIPLTACLFIELSSPSKALFRAFQDEEIDLVATIQHLETAKKQMERLKPREFF